MRKLNSNNKGMGSLGAALVGVAVGATAVALSNKDTREKIKTKFQQAKQTGQDKLQQVEDKAKDMEAKGKKSLSESLGRAQEKLDQKSKRRVNQA